MTEGKIVCFSWKVWNSTTYLEILVIFIHALSFLKSNYSNDWYGVIQQSRDALMNGNTDVLQQGAIVNNWKDFARKHLKELCYTTMKIWTDDTKINQNDGRRKA